MSTPSNRHARWRREWVGVSTLLALLAFIMGAGAWTWRLDQAVYDLGLSLWPRPAPSDIVMVTIDEDSLRQLGHWPWPRAIHGAAIERISSAAPKAILLDLLLSEPARDPTQDQALAKALKASGKVVLPLTFESTPDHAVRTLRPTEALASLAHLAHADAELDADGVMRWAYLHAGIAPEWHPHLALALLEVAGESMHPRIRPQSAPVDKARLAASGHAWRRDERVLIRYGGPAGSVPKVSFAAVLRGDVPPETFQGKFVLIGATALGLGDGHQTPASGSLKVMPDVEITANLLNMLRTGAGIRPVASRDVGLVSAGLVLALMLAYVRLTSSQALLLTLASALGAAALAVVMLSMGVWFAPAAFMLTALLAYPIWSWRRLETTRQFLDAEISRLALAHTDPGQNTARRHVPHDDVERRIATIQEANVRLTQAQQLLANTLKAMPEAVLVVDSAGQARQANPQFNTLLDISAPAALPGQPIDALLARWMPTDAPRWSMLIDRVLSEDRTVITEVHGPLDQHLLARIAPLPAVAGQSAWVVLCLADITPIRLIEQQRDDLLGFIAHDIRSPQASLISLVQLQGLTRSAMAPEEVLEHVDTLARSTLALCDELLQIMRAEKHPVQLHATLLPQLVEQALKEVDLQAKVKGIALTREWAAADHHSLVQLDSSLVRRALVNLLNNAVKFSPPGSEVRVHLGQSEGFKVIAIIDQGPGIPAAELKKLFRRYERLESSTASRVTAGVGLGLVFIDTVARRHGGHVHVHSEEGQGSRFELWLPSS
ncbi:MAG: CHASE2 domain-containing protein [Rubrivivax sp.]|nr:MAG: CHASE2 domain-containing protein [Rubrivivax sp.]